MLFAAACIILSLAGCTKDYSDEEVETYIRDTLNISSFTVLGEPEEVEGEDGYTDKMWTVSTKEPGLEEEVVFHVYNDYYYGMEWVENRLDDDLNYRKQLAWLKDFPFPNGVVTEEYRNSSGRTDSVGIVCSLKKRADFQTGMNVITALQEQLQQFPGLTDTEITLCFRVEADDPDLIPDQMISGREYALSFSGETTTEEAENKIAEQAGRYLMDCIENGWEDDVSVSVEEINKATGLNLDDGTPMQEIVIDETLLSLLQKNADTFISDMQLLNTEKIYFRTIEKAGDSFVCCMERRRCRDDQEFPFAGGGDRDTMKAIFCDVDGVLNNAWTMDRSPGGYVGVSGELIGNLRKIVVATDAVIILSSDWRLLRDQPVRKKDYRYLANRLRIKGSLDIYDYTDDINWSSRGKEIRKYLKDHPGITEYVVLDDIPFSDFERYEHLPHLILTDPEFGLTEQDVERAIRILQGEAAGNKTVE